MINKKVFEEDIVSSMQRNLVSKTQESAMEKLAHAIECLNSAAEILDNANFQEQSEKILGLLAKVAQVHGRKRKDFSKLTPELLEKLGWLLKDYKRSEIVNAVLNRYLYDAGFTYNEIVDFIGKDYAIPPKAHHETPAAEKPSQEVHTIEIEEPIKVESPAMLDMGTPKNPYVIDAAIDNFLEALGGPPVDATLDEELLELGVSPDAILRMYYGDKKVIAAVNAHLITKLGNLGMRGKEIKEKMKSLLGEKYTMSLDELRRYLSPKNSSQELMDDISRGKDFLGKDLPKIEAKNKKHDRHTKGLTSEKMIENLKHHGTVFNLSDDGQMSEDNMDIDDKEIDDLLDDEPTFEEET
jgi:hypothetical protein